TAGLKVNEELKKLEPAPDAAEGGTGEGGAGPGAAGPSTGGTGEAGKEGVPGRVAGPGGAGASAGDATRVNKIPRKRYMHVTPQTRHMPVAMRLVVDEAHIHDVLAAVSNNRMRIQVTQVVAHHVADVEPPGAAPS